MKKQFLIAAVSAASVLSMSSAVAVDTLTLYGKASFGIKNFDAGKAEGAATASDSVLSISSMDTGSRWGIKGSENLGGGVKANFVFESGLTSTLGTAGSSSLNDRNSYLEIETPGAGTFGLGRITDATDWVVGGTNTNGAAVGNPLIDWGVGRTNHIYWSSPNWSGFKANLTYSPDSDRDGAKPKLTATALGLTYDMDALHVLFGYSSYEAAEAGTALIVSSYEHSNGVVVTAPTSLTPAHADNKTKNTTTSLGASYSFGSFSVGLLGQQLSSKASTDSDASKATYMQLSLGANFGKSSVGFGYGKLSDKKQGESTTEDSNASSIMLSYDYSLTKRTSLAAGYVNTTNAKASALGGASGKGADPSSFVLGILHNF